MPLTGIDFHGDSFYLLKSWIKEAQYAAMSGSQVGYGQVKRLDAGQDINFADLAGISRALCKDILG